jgi:hypothetical protein
MTADLTIQYAVILGDDDGTRLTLVGDTAADLAQHVHATLTGWPEVKEWDEFRAITENGAMRFERHARWARPILEEWVRGFVRCNDETPDAGIPDLHDDLVTYTIRDSFAWQDLKYEWRLNRAYESVMQARDTAAWRAAVR